MIYEYTAEKGLFVIEWARPDAWGERNATKWMASCQGVALARGPQPDVVLDALVKGDCFPMLDGSNPAAVRLPPNLDGWRKSRE